MPFVPLPEQNVALLNLRQSGKFSGFIFEPKKIKESLSVLAVRSTRRGYFQSSQRR
jgi:hypothetical protein